MAKSIDSGGMKALLVLALGIFLVLPAQAQSAAGKLYKTKCVACHAADGSGDTVMGKKLGTHDFCGPDVKKMSDADLTGIITKGKGKMPGYEKTLKPDEIKGLVAYIRSLAAKK